ncbi:MAG: glycoside hydrolase family 3 protein [Clostridia bacterium]|nr:glycoside hydrolase family 3 protein [Clostridia bacterium]
MKIDFKKILFFVIIIAVIVAVALLIKPEAPQPEPVISPSPQVTQVPDEKPVLSRVDEILGSMTLREKLYQMFIVAPDMLAGEDNVQSLTPALKERLETFPVGGLVYFSENISSTNQIKTLIAETAKISEIPMFVAVDQEGGKVARLKENAGFPLFENMYEYKDMGTDTAYENAKTIAENMATLGFNLDFAPVADVWSNKENTVIGKRAYSDDFEQAGVLVSSAVKGFHDGGIICTLKHFPGHGSTYQDSHDTPAYITKTKEEIDKTEILPFKAGIEAGADIVMVGHLTVSDIDGNVPATVSKAFVTDYLKNELGFNGLVITDALNMGAVANMYEPGDLAVKAVKAGVDILLMPMRLRLAAAGIEEAVLNGEISEQRINESVRKILELKLKYGIIK